MKWRDHSKLKGLHAFLSASKYHWINYDDEKLEKTFNSFLAAERGTRLHEFASEAIALNQKLPRTPSTLNMFVNDAIGYKMDTEKTLYYSDNCFGTCDAISFRKNLLRIHDYKSGVTKSSFSQLEIYAALFCLEYGYSPNDIDIELRLYQSNLVDIHIPEPEAILYIMEKIIAFDKMIDQIKLGE